MNSKQQNRVHEKKRISPKYVIAMIIVVAIVIFWLGQRYVAQVTTQSVVKAVQNGFSEQHIYHLSDQTDCSGRVVWKDCAMTSWHVLVGSTIDRKTVIERMMTAGFTAQKQFSTGEVFSQKTVNGVEGVADFSAPQYTSQVIVYDVKTLPIAPPKQNVSKMSNEMSVKRRSR